MKDRLILFLGLGSLTLVTSLFFHAAIQGDKQHETINRDLEDSQSAAFSKNFSHDEPIGRDIIEASYADAATLDDAAPLVGSHVEARSDKKPKDKQHHKEDRKKAPAGLRN